MLTFIISRAITSGNCWETRARGRCGETPGRDAETVWIELLGYVIIPEHVHVLIEQVKRSSARKSDSVFKQRSSHQMRGSFAEDAGSVVALLAAPVFRP